ncbi:MAG: biotin carboxylase [Pseudomonadales bacterium]
MAAKKKLTSLTDIYSFFRKNELPVYFVSPTAYNILGLGQWVRTFKYISHFDSFDGYHPRVLNPRALEPRDFESMEEIVNYLLSHKETVDLIRANGPGGKLLTVMFDEETESLCDQLGLEIALPSAALRQRLDSKIVTTQLASEVGVASAPNVLGTANTYADLSALAQQHGLGSNLVVQTPYGDSGRTTFFIQSEHDWSRHADKIIGEQLKVMKYINHVPGTVEAVATRCGTLVGPLQTDITGFAELTPYKGGWCGDDLFAGSVTEVQQTKIQQMARAMGDRLYAEGYRGTFCFDYLLDVDDGEVYLGEVNPRISGASPLTNLVTSKYGGAPLMLFHLLEFMDVDFDINIEQVQSRWSDFDSWTQLVLKQSDDKTEQITKAPMSGIWRMQDDQSIKFVRRSIDWHNVADENEAFYMRVHGVGEYCYSGADMGILVTRGRMQSDERQLLPRAKVWISAIHKEFESIPIPPRITHVTPEAGIRKML